TRIFPLKEYEPF
ncbi:unnamed protein product, partial [Allacma fusca]